MAMRQLFWTSQGTVGQDRLVAERENLDLQTVQADMTQAFLFEDESFDIIFCPVSNVYVEDLTNMWQESYRVLKKEACSWLAT